MFSDSAASLAILWVVNLAQTPPPVGWDWGAVAEKYGVLGLFCLYLIFRGEKKLDSFTKSQTDALNENTKAIKVMTEAFAEGKVAELMALAASSTVAPVLQRAATEHADKLREIIAKTET